MEDIRKKIYKSFDLSLDFFTNCENFLLQLEQEEKDNPDLMDIPTELIEEIFEDIHNKCYSRDNIEVENEILFKEFLEYTPHNFVLGTDKKGYFVLFCATQGITFSKTSWNRFKKKFTLEDINRIRLYCLIENHNRTDDDFIKELIELNFKWKKIKIKNPMRIYSRFPQIAL